MDYLKKIDNLPTDDLEWNIPEQKQGAVNVVGGNLQNFRVPVKVTEFVTEKYPVKEVNLVLPEALKSKLPPLPGLKFAPATESGSFGESVELLEMIDLADYNLLIGDFSKNKITARAVASACKNSAKPLLITRDGVDLLAEEVAAETLMNNNLVIMASVVQLQKLLKAVYYPRMLLLTQSLVQIAETLHKFTLSYPVAIVTLHNNQMMVAKNGEVAVTPLENTGYSPLTLWSGELAAKIMAYNLYNPNNLMRATLGALFSR